MKATIVVDYKPLMHLLAEAETTAHYLREYAKLLDPMMDSFSKSLAHSLREYADRLDEANFAVIGHES